MDIEDDIMEMRAEEQAQMAEAKITLFELVTSPTLKFPLLIAVIMQLSQQLSGINAVIYLLFISIVRVNLNTYWLIIGVLLLDKPVHNHWIVRNGSQIRDDWHWNRHGHHDIDFYSLDGQIRKTNSPSLRTWRNVHLFDFHHHFIFSKG